LSPALIVWLAIPIFDWDLASGDGGLTPTGDTLQWSYASAPAAGPGPGEPAWGTVPDGSYLNESDDSLGVDLPDLSSATNPHLIVDQWVAVRAGDLSVIEIDDGTGFVEVEPVGGYPSADGFSGTDSTAARWENVVVPVPSVASARVRLRLVSNALLADDGWYIRSLELLDGDVVPPMVSPVEEPVDTQDVLGPYDVTVDIADDGALLYVQLHHRIDGVEQPPIDMNEDSPGRYTGAIPAPPIGPRSTVEWWVEASDGEQASRYPGHGNASFQIFLAAPENLQADVPERFVGQAVPLAWEPPVSPNAVLDYEVRAVLGSPGCDETGAAPVSTSAPEAVWPLSGEAISCVEVVARYDVGGGVFGEPSAPLTLGIEVPLLQSLSPERGYAGSVQWVDLVGTSLYLDPARPPELGPGATVTQWQVLDAHHGRLQLALDANLPTGSLDLQLTGLYGEASFPEAFEVDDASDAPRILSVTPSSVTQGDDVELVVVASDPWGTEISVDGGADVFTTAPAVRGPAPSGTPTNGTDASNTRLVVPLSISTRARLGERTILIDDGVRLWTVPLTVEEYRAPIRQRCEVGVAPGSLGWIVPLVGLMRRRRRR